VQRTRRPHWPRTTSSAPGFEFGIGQSSANGFARNPFVLGDARTSNAHRFYSWQTRTRTNLLPPRTSASRRSRSYARNKPEWIITARERQELAAPAVPASERQRGQHADPSAVREARARLEKTISRQHMPRGSASP
jgi:hypothetical protein